MLRTQWCCRLTGTELLTGERPAGPHWVGLSSRHGTGQLPPEPSHLRPSTHSPLRTGRPRGLFTWCLCPVEVSLSLLEAAREEPLPNNPPKGDVFKSQDKRSAC